MKTKEEELRKKIKNLIEFNNKLVRRIKELYKIIDGKSLALEEVREKIEKKIKYYDKIYLKAYDNEDEKYIGGNIYNLKVQIEELKELLSSLEEKEISSEEGKGE